MLTQITGAAVRASLVALFFATPALILPDDAASGSSLVLLVAMLAGFLVFSEYYSVSPSIISFRDAAPLNRLRFLQIFFAIYMLSLIAKGKIDPTLTTNTLTSIAIIAGNFLDFPYSPVNLVVATCTNNNQNEIATALPELASLSYLLSLLMIVSFVFLLCLTDWPKHNGAFNVWINLPLFDPTAGGDTLHRLRRCARLYVISGAVLPFIMPLIIGQMTELLHLVYTDNPQTLIWMITLWAFLPANMIIRGLAINKVARMIAKKRRSTYANSKERDELQFI